MNTNNNKRPNEKNQQRSNQNQQNKTNNKIQHKNKNKNENNNIKKLTNRAIHVTPIITTDGSEQDKELLYHNKVATRTLDFVFVYMVTAKREKLYSQSYDRILETAIPPQTLQISSCFSATEFSAENQRVRH